MTKSRREFLDISKKAAVGGLLVSVPQGKGHPPRRRGSGRQENYILEPAKKVPVVRSVDVVVAGAGVSGLFAALGAAKYGAKTILVDRFGELGGNIGPGIFVGGQLYQEVKRVLHGGRMPGIPKVFVDQVEAIMGELPRDFITSSQAVSRIAIEMMKQAGVETIVPVYPSDPVLERNCVCGLFLETRSGRVCIRAKVVVDATGEADIARRAGAPFRRGSSAAECDSPNVWVGYRQPQYKTWNDGGLYFVVANADIAKYNAFSARQYDLTSEEKQWFDGHLNYVHAGWTPAMVPILRQGWESGEFEVIREVDHNVYVCLNNYWFAQLAPGLAGSRSQVHGEYDAGDWRHVAVVEAELRALTYDAMRFYRRHVPGFENSYLVSMSSFLGTRGGPHIEGEYTLTPQESYAGLRRTDTLFVTYIEASRGGNAKGHDMPYAMLLPRKVDGLLVTGRGASYLRRGHDPSTRARPNMMTLGQATGMAAALAVRDGVQPRALNVKRLQRALVQEGFYLGDDARLSDLGL